MRMVQIGKQSATDQGFLFLQGPSCSLFAQVAENIEAAGGRCIRVNLNAGDWIFWRRGRTLNYRGRLSEWPNYVRRCLEDNNIRNIVVHGEERPYHRAAIEEARRVGAAIYVVEMGYLRPDWITLEREGLSSNSHFPTDPKHIVQAASRLPDPDMARHFAHSFFTEAVLDLLYYLPTVFLWFPYPHYRRHGLFHPLAEYAGWLRRLSTSRKRSKAARAVQDRLLAEKPPFFVYPLQLQTDYQLRAHSPYRRQQDAIFEILRSFAANAPSNALLLIKVHPLDNGLIAWDRIVARLSLSLGLGPRVLVIDGGDLDVLAAASLGMVTVNSTAALPALQAGKPVKVLGAAIYDIDGLVDRQPLDQFWEAPRSPSAEIFRAFIRLLAASIQVRGSFYNRKGIQSAAAEIAERLLSRTVNMPDGYVEPAPRARPVKI